MFLSCPFHFNSLLVNLLCHDFWGSKLHLNCWPEIWGPLLGYDAGATYVGADGVTVFDSSTFAPIMALPQNINDPGATASRSYLGDPGVPVVAQYENAGQRNTVTRQGRVMNDGRTIIEFELYRDTARIQRSIGPRKNAVTRTASQTDERGSLSSPTQGQNTGRTRTYATGTDEAGAYGRFYPTTRYMSPYEGHYTAPRETGTFTRSTPTPSEATPVYQPKFGNPGTPK